MPASMFEMDGCEVWRYLCGNVECQGIARYKRDLRLFLGLQNQWLIAAKGKMLPKKGVFKKFPTARD